MTTRSRRTTATQEAEALLSARNPTDVVVLIPYLLGYHPLESLVVLVVSGQRVGWCARLDLPTDEGTAMRRPGQRTDRSAAQQTADQQLADLATAAAAVVARPKADAALLVSYGSDRKRSQQVLDRVLEEFARRGVAVPEAVYADGSRWWSRTCRAPCCPAGGTPYDAGSSPLAAEAVYAGLDALPDRSAVRRSVKGPPQADLIRLRARLRAGPTSTGPELASGSAAGRRQLIDQQLELRELVRSALGESADGPGEEVTLRLAALVATDVRVRDAALAMISTTDAGRQLRLWQAVVATAPPELACAPLVVLGAAAWAAGNGTLLSCCAERALELDPRYRLAEMLLDVGRRGAPPEVWNELAGPLRAVLPKQLRPLRCAG